MSMNYKEEVLRRVAELTEEQARGIILYLEAHPLEEETPQAVFQTSCERG